MPEDRAHPERRSIELRIAVAPALARAPAADPLFLLAGGPGQAASEVLPPLVDVLELVHRTRDIVLVDQRGTGSSHPLRCDPYGKGATLPQRLRAATPRPDRLRECLGSYDADVRFYTTSTAMQDLDEVRQALGYSKIDLWGVSYGTRAALIYLREHGEHVRAAVLDGVDPISLRVPVASAQDAQRAMDLLFEHCAAEEACGAAFPRLRDQLADLLNALSRRPAHARVSDAFNGAPTEVEISRDLFANGLRGVLHLENVASLVPLIVSRAASGDFGPFVAATATSPVLRAPMSFGLLFSVLCSEDLRHTTRDEVEAAARNTFLGPGFALDFLEVCSFWPRGDVPTRFDEPVASDKPVLLLSGELDPVTPPRWAEDARKTLPNSIHLVVPGIGHGASGEGCLPGIIARFFDEAAPASVDRACLAPLRRPPFFVSSVGPPP